MHQVAFTRDLVSYPDPVLYEGTLRLVQLSDIDWRPVYNPIPGVPSNVLGSETVGRVQVRPSTLDPEPCTLNHAPCTLHPEP